jgi:hypothetical protein
MEFRGAARIRAAATDVAWSAVALANEVHYNVLSNLCGFPFGVTYSYNVLVRVAFFTRIT